MKKKKGDEGLRFISYSCCGCIAREKIAIVHDVACVWKGRAADPVCPLFPRSVVQRQIYSSTHLGAREDLVDERVDGRRVTAARGGVFRKKFLHVDG